MPESAKKMERFLEDFANLHPGDDGESRGPLHTSPPTPHSDTELFLRRYQSFFPPSFPREFEDCQREQDGLLRGADFMQGVVNPVERSDSEIREATHMALWGLASQLRKIWDEADIEAKEWYVDELRRWFYIRTEPARSRQIPAPPPSKYAFQEALKHLKNNADRARHCMRPGCSKPYYFSEDRRVTRYCGPGCVQWAKDDAKLRWDRKHRSPKAKR